MSFHFQPAFVSLYTAIVQAKLPTASYTVTSTLSKVSIRVEWPLLRTLAVQLDGGKHRTLSLSHLSPRYIVPATIYCAAEAHSVPDVLFSSLNHLAIFSFSFFHIEHVKYMECLCVCATGKFLLSQQQQLCGQRSVCFFRASPSASVHLSQRQGRQTPCTLPNAVR